MVDTSLVKVACNWSRIGGCEFSQALQIKNADPDVFIRPSLDEIVNQENAILLSKGPCREHCELLMTLYPHYKIQSFSLVCNVMKVEVFHGKLKEYLETVYGVIEDDCEDDEFKSYRYDVEVEKSGITELTIKFLTLSEVCLFGIVLQTAPNPNGITTLLPAVQNLLQNTSIPLSPASEKCKEFLEMMTKGNPLPRSQQDIQEHRNINQLQNMGIATEDLSGNSSVMNKPLDNVALQDYIDSHFRRMEERLNERLELMEKRQMEKFDCLLQMVEKLDRKSNDIRI